MSIFRLRDESSGEGVEGELMHGIKIPQQDFSLKMQVELMHEGGGGICGTLRYIHHQKVTTACMHRHVFRLLD